ncbi:hypothetical protein [Amycolatopsis thermophila]|uniref:Uncharacterized protein n=1 Tax=Amycolatopsis thermophila TaxID=206084 RepID=A0ABU0ER08_9PSEU|nr:hypothetical protein [Amycolatopsis thermophila]MDQ0377735.1 hypothetical protein [Amycolatopsis thermophila]
MDLIRRMGYAVGRVVGGTLRLVNAITGIPAGGWTQSRHGNARDQRRR